MIKEKTCCGFVAKLCRKLCGKKKSEIKPDVQPVGIIQMPSEILVKLPIPEHQSVFTGHKSKIITGSGKQPISFQSSIGYINSDEKRPIAKTDSQHNNTYIEPPEFFYDNAGLDSKRLNTNTVIENLDEAYRIIQNEEGLSPNEKNEKFTKVIKGINFKDILADADED